ncbi:hypothetical protein [Methylobacterium sp. NFXW15]|uniref:hypothetical protein n=1 Tax=Methylobacterium sp. NFXW15 TaxID=2819512 RepID=UPI003CEBD11E
MKGISISFDSQVTSYAAAHKLQLSREELEHLGATLNSICTVDDASQVSFDIGGGRVGSITDALDVFAVGMGKPVSSPTTKPSIPEGTNATARALAANAATRDGQSAARRTEGQALADQHGNPWHHRTINRTRQGLISNLHPQLAERLRAEAGARS